MTAATDGVLDVDLVRRTFEANVFGAARMIEAATPLLLRSPSGRIVNVSTLGGPDNRAAAPLTADEAAVVVAAAAMDRGTSGRFVDAAGEVPW